MRTIAVVNQKGGCGKTITSINLSAFLACAQRRVLLVDMDPQGHATLGLLAAAAPSSRTMYEVFSRRAGKEPTGLREVILSVRENLDVAPADIFLSAIPEMLAGLAGRYFETIIRYSIKLAEAASHGVPIAQYCRHCAGFDDYQALVAEVLRREAENPCVALDAHATRTSARHRGAGPSSPIVTPQEVTFTIEAPDAEHVLLAGDFNDSTPAGSELDPLAQDGRACSFAWARVVCAPRSPRKCRPAATSAGHQRSARRHPSAGLERGARGGPAHDRRQDPVLPVRRDRFARRRSYEQAHDHRL